MRRSFLADAADRLFGDAGVAGAVVVQARTTLEENEFLLAQARRSQTICGIVGWVDLCSHDVAGQIERHCADPLFKGVREITQGAPDGQFFEHAGFNAGIGEVTRSGLICEILVYQAQLRVATTFIDRHPEQRFVLDHAGKPEIRDGAFPADWERDIREMARREHLVCKLSGLVTEIRDASWNADVLRCYVDVLLDAFGAERLMFGSDWPVCLLASEYRIWQTTARELVSNLSEGEQERVFSGTAHNFYSL